MKKRKVKIPLVLKLIRTSFPMMEKLSPKFANRFAFQLFFKPFRYKMPERELSAYENAVKFKLNVEGKSIQCYSWGNGPVVLFVHGWSGRATQFHQFVEKFTSAGYKVIAFDGPAHGKSQGNTTNILEFEKVLNQLEELYNGFEGIVSHSFGGAAVLYAIQQGLNTKRVVNIGSPTNGEEILTEYVKRINGSPGIINNFNQLVKQMYGKSFFEFGSIEVANTLPPLDLKLIHDQSDREVSYQQAVQLHKKIPGTELLLTEGLGHSRILRDHAVIEEALSFIDQHKLILEEVGA